MRHYDKNLLMRDVCDLNHARESMYGHLPDEAFDAAIINPALMLSREFVEMLGFGASSRTPEEAAAMIGIVCDTLLFALQEAVRQL